jgi:hypothetical protein
MSVGWKALAVACALAIAACASSSDAVTDEGELSLATGGDLWINPCRKLGGELVCSPQKMSILPGERARTQTSALPEVRLTLRADAMPGLYGSTVDTRNRRIFWHAACDRSFFVTDVDSGRTERFPLRLAELGIEDIGRGFCLGEWVFDEKRGEAIVLAGRATHQGKSTVDFVIAVKANGEARFVQDLRPVVDPRWMFVHQMQTIAVLDPDRDEITAPLIRIPGGESRLILNLTTGAVSFPGPGGGRQHSFFDIESRRVTYFNCDIPGWTSSHDDGPSRIAIPRNELAAKLGTQDPCHQGFVGGGYDPIGHRTYVLLRTGVIDDPRKVFVLAVAGLSENRWLGFIDTDLSYGRVGPVAMVGANLLFLSTEFVPR